MELEIRGKNLDITKQIEDYIHKRMERVWRRLDNRGGGKVELVKDSTRSQDDRIVAQITININGVLLRAQERGPDIFSAIDVVTDVIARRVSRYKGRTHPGEKAKKSGRAFTIRKESSDYLEEAPPALGEVVRTKMFKMKPMTVEEAIIQMELLGHSFFLFLNGTSNQYNVLYKRQDGNYGIIEPDMA